MITRLGLALFLGICAGCTTHSELDPEPEVRFVVRALRGELVDTARAADVWSANDHRDTVFVVIRGLKSDAPLNLRVWAVLETLDLEDVAAEGKVRRVFWLTRRFDDAADIPVRFGGRWVVSLDPRNALNTLDGVAPDEALVRVDAVVEAGGRESAASLAVLPPI